MNLEQIAKLSGVSRSTVSRVINNDPNVSDATREKVRQVVRQFDYKPGAAARGLTAGRTHVLGLVIPMDVSALFIDPYFPSLIQGISSACDAHAYSVMWWLAEPEYERRQIRQIMRSGLIDGVIVASTLENDALVQALSEGDVPFVLISRHPIDLHTSHVDADDDLPIAAHTNPPPTTLGQPIHRSGAMAVEVLIELIEQPVHKVTLDEVVAAREHGEQLTFLAGIGVRPFRVSLE